MTPAKATGFAKVPADAWKSVAGVAAVAATLRKVLLRATMTVVVGIIIITNPVHAAISTKTAAAAANRTDPHPASWTGTFPCPSVTHLTIPFTVAS